MAYGERMALTSVLAMFTSTIKSFKVPEKIVLIAIGAEQISSNLAVLKFESLNSVHPYIYAY